ncbi:MAG: transcriptional regulator, TetR family [Candidatus Solibacter sp.]|nr:transcriptional regulator, TetR family [Candidatus Solibacter sp.]
MAVSSPGRKAATEKRRCAILQAARAVFARQGYASTVVDDIATQAGIAKGTLYLYFPSKEQIYLAALLEEARQLDADSRAAMNAAPTWREKLGAYLQVRLNYFESHQDFLRIYMSEFRGMFMHGKLNPEFMHLIQQGEAQLAQVFAVAAARGEIRPVNPELAAATVSDLSRGIMERQLRNWGRPVGPDDAAFALDVLCRALAA